MKTVKTVGVAILFTVLAGCASYALVEPGASEHSGLRINTSQAWNRVPSQLLPNSRKASQTWTQDGVLLDRLMIIPAVPEGETIFKPASKSAALPEFRRDMNPKEIEELVESSITQLFGEGEVIVETNSLRPHRFDDRTGFLFNLEMAVNDGPDYSGIAGALVVNGKLNLVKRFELARKAFSHTAKYDAAISAFLAEQAPDGVTSVYDLIGLPKKHGG